MTMSVTAKINQNIEFSIAFICIPVPKPLDTSYKLLMSLEMTEVWKSLNFSIIRYRIKIIIEKTVYIPVVRAKREITMLFRSVGITVNIFPAL